MLPLTKRGGSLNKLILAILEQALVPKKSDRDELIQRIRERRETMGFCLNDEGLSAAILRGSF